MSGEKPQPAERQEEKEEEEKGGASAALPHPSSCWGLSL